MSGEHHYDDFGHMFTDIFVPAEWNKIHGVAWRALATDLRDQFDEMGMETMVGEMNDVLDADEDRDWGTRFCINSWHHCFFIYL